MPVTPDRRPGPLVENEELQLGSNPTTPSVAGGVLYNGTSFQMRDSVGTFNPRGAGGGSPGGSADQVQFNSAGVFGGASGLLVDVNGRPIVSSEQPNENNSRFNTAAGVWPAAPTAGATFFARRRARVMPAFREAGSGPTGGLAFHPAFWEERPSWWIPNGNGTGITAVGVGATATGTATARNVANSDNFTYGRRIAYVSGATAGSSAGARGNALQFAMTNGFHFVCRFGFNAFGSPGNRFFIGFTNAAAAIGNVEPSSLTTAIGIGVDTTDTTIQAFTNGTKTPLLTNETSGGAEAPAQLTGPYEVHIYVPYQTAQARFSLENLSSNIATKRATVTTPLPAPSTLLSPQVWINNGAVAAAVSFDLYFMYLGTFL